MAIDLFCCRHEHNISNGVCYAREHMGFDISSRTCCAHTYDCQTCPAHEHMISNCGASAYEHTIIICVRPEHKHTAITVFVLLANVRAHAHATINMFGQHMSLCSLIMFVLKMRM